MVQQLPEEQLNIPSVQAETTVVTLERGPEGQTQKRKHKIESDLFKHWKLMRSFKD